MHFEMFSLPIKESLSAYLNAAQGCHRFFLVHAYLILSLFGFRRDLPGLVLWADDLDDKSSCSAITATLHVLFILIILSVVLFLLLQYFGHMVLSFSTNTEALLVQRMANSTELIFHFTSHLWVNEREPVKGWRAHSY